jgi:hypothetical protein
MMIRFSLATLFFISLLSGYFLYLNTQSHRMTVYVMDGSELGHQNNIGQPELAVVAYGWPRYFDYEFVNPDHYEGFINPQPIVDRRRIDTLIINILACAGLCLAAGFTAAVLLAWISHPRRPFEPARTPPSRSAARPLSARYHTDR